MPAVPRQFKTSMKFETRALNVQAELSVYAVQGKGRDSGWSALKRALEDLGFRFSRFIDDAPNDAKP